MHIIPYCSEIVDYIPLSTIQIAPVTKGTGCAYIIECKPFPKKFLPNKAKALGVSPGPLFGKLSNGETIVVNGRTITPEEVTEPGPPQSIVVILDLPNSNNCKELGEKLKIYLQDDYNLSLFVHFTSKEVLLSQSYLEMILDFPNTKNLVFDPVLTQSNSIFKKSDELLLQLNHILPSAFPIPFNPQSKIDANLHETFNQVIPNLVIPNYLTKVFFSYQTGNTVDRNEEIKAIDPTTLLENMGTSMALSKSLSCNYSDLVDLSIPGSDPEILFLGTASMKPGTHRNVSGIYVSQWGGGLLLDCGEGSYSQLVRAFGENISNVLLDLKGILITHLHADHHLGIIKVLSERAKLTNSPLTVVAPELYRIYLNTCEKTMGPLSYQFQSLDKINIQDLTIKAVPVDHRIEAYAFILNHNSGWKLVYSGDTRPSPLLIQEGFKATILIHEATLDDSLLDHAIMKYHSTLGEALQVASAMEAWKVILTHFSQRYSKIPENTKVDAIYAFDLMKFKFSDCTELVGSMPTLLQHWQEDEEET